MNTKTNSKLMKPDSEYTPEQLAKLEKYKHLRGKQSDGFILAIGGGASAVVTPEQKAAWVARGHRAQSAIAEKRRKFLEDAKVYSKLMDKLPPINAEEIIRLRIHQALKEEQLEDAARWAEKLMEYQKPKLARVEKTVKLDTADMSDEDLQRALEEEGLVEVSSNVVPIKRGRGRPKGSKTLARKNPLAA